MVHANKTKRSPPADHVDSTQCASGPPNIQLFFKSNQLAFLKAEVEFLICILLSLHYLQIQFHRKPTRHAFYATLVGIHYCFFFHSLLKALLFRHNFPLKKVRGAALRYPSTHFTQFCLQWEWVYGLHPDHWDRFYVSGPTLNAPAFYSLCNLKIPDCSFSSPILYSKHAKLSTGFQKIILLTSAPST